MSSPAAVHPAVINPVVTSLAAHPAVINPVVSSPAAHPAVINPAAVLPGVIKLVVVCRIGCRR